MPEKITIDESAANEAAIKSYNEEHGTAIAIRKVKYSQYRGTGSSWSKAGHASHAGVQVVYGRPGHVSWIELMHMIRKKQMVVEAGEEGLTAAEQSTLSPLNLRTDRDNCPFMTF